MALDTTTTETTATSYVVLAKDRWQPFFDAVTKVIEGMTAEIEVIGLDLGDQIQAEWAPLDGLTYDRKAETFYVYTENDDGDFAHAIARPREILVQMGAHGVEQVVVMDEEQREHIIRLRQPLMLPDASRPR